MFYDCEAQAGSAGFAGPAFVDSVESFKDALLLVFGDADAGVLYREKGVVLLLAGPDQDGAVFAIVLDGILDEVFDEFLQEVPVSGKYSGISLTGKREIAGPGADREVSAAFLSQMTLNVKQDGDSILFDAPADQTAQLTDWVCLGTFYSGAEIDLDVTLNVPIEMGNDCQDKIGALDWQFKVEEFPIEKDDPKTGDNMNLIIPVALMAAALAGIIAIIAGKRKRQE
jgi:LPXTG-motif cell wall-anchored protein